MVLSGEPYISQGIEMKLKRILSAVFILLIIMFVGAALYLLFVDSTVFSKENIRDLFVGVLSLAGSAVLVYVFLVTGTTFSEWRRERRVRQKLEARKAEKEMRKKYRVAVSRH
ncbi:MAG: hypothetical protein AAB355_00635 [Patescibacteria group bacterium]